jgi:thioredoxin 1
MVTPVLKQIAGEREITIAKVNTDINPVSSGRFGVRGIPALLLFRDGEMIDRMTGAMPKNGMDAWLNRHMT